MEDDVYIVQNDNIFVNINLFFLFVEPKRNCDKLDFAKSLRDRTCIVNCIA